MTRFFPESITKTLTEQSRHYVDWSRVGSLIASGTHRYTWHELAERGLVVASMAYGAYQGYHRADEARGLNVTSGLYSMAGCFVGFVVSHLLVLGPLLYKRHQMHQHCQASEERIVILLNAMREIDRGHDGISALIAQIASVVDETMALSLSDDKHARASQTWGLRMALMEKITKKLDDDVHSVMNADERDVVLTQTMAFWSQPQAVLHLALLDRVPREEHVVHLKVG